MISITAPILVFNSCFNDNVGVFCNSKTAYGYAFYWLKAFFSFTIVKLQIKYSCLKKSIFLRLSNVTYKEWFDSKYILVRK